jgi:hypothetical protein
LHAITLSPTISVVKTVRTVSKNFLSRARRGHAPQLPRGQAAARRLQGAWPTLRLVHLPIHASWLNQVEVYFSVIQRKILTPSDFGSLAEAEAALLAFPDYYQRIATPFEWKFSKSDLDLLLKRLAAREPAPALAA